MSKKVRPEYSSSRIFFNETCLDGVYRLIFSYIPENSDCYHFALTCKHLFLTFKDMLRRSSTRYYRLCKMNNTLQTNRINQNDFVFDLFNPSTTSLKFELDEQRNVLSIDEYEKNIKKHVFFQILSEINQKYGNVVMISGGYALRHFYKQSSQFRTSDIDIFILSKNKKKLCCEILMDMRKRFKNPKKFVIFYNSDYGLINVEVRRDLRDTGVDIPYDLQDSKHPDIYFHYPDDKVEKMDSDEEREMLSNRQRNYYTFDGYNYRKRFYHSRTRNLYQFILKNVHDTPSDVFCFFDLDCCKIGYFPNLPKGKVVACPSFIRSIRTGVNYCDLDHRRASFKHQKRMYRYVRRTGIISCVNPEPLFSLYHDFRKKRIRKKNPLKIYVWGNEDNENGFGSCKSCSYYYKNPKKKKEKRNEYKTLKRFRGKKIPIDENLEEPYLCNSVGLLKRKNIENGKIEYYYDTPKNIKERYERVYFYDESIGLKKKESRKGQKGQWDYSSYRYGLPEIARVYEKKFF